MPEISTKLKFILGNVPVELDLGNHPLYNPSTTLLNYLRSLSDRKGVKEGCAEGDCGACTVVIASPTPEGRLHYQAVNSCLIFLPFLHGKQLITIEDLAEKGELHPVQQMMVELYGSQCGFCTPGIVMSLFALYKSNETPNRENVQLALGGNLCRCTGYQPIAEAGLMALKADGFDRFSSKESEIIQLLESMETGPLAFKNNSQSYFRPIQLQEALRLKKEHPDALLCSGATDLALRQSKKFEHLPKILDISGVKEISFFEETENSWKIGSGLNIEELRNKAGDDIPMFSEVFNVFASKQIRNLATLGGNIGSASPIGDTLPVLFALNAEAELVSPGGTRKIPVEDFITGYRKTVLKPDEIIHSIIIPKPLKSQVYRFQKLSKRKDLDISTVSLAARIEFDDTGKILNTVLAYGGMADRPARAIKTESQLMGMELNPFTIEKAAEIAYGEFRPISDARASGEARNIMARNLLIKLLVEISEQMHHE